MINRRQFLFAGFLAGVAPTSIGAADFWSQPRWLWLYRPSTKEEVREYYWINGQLHWPGYEKICRLLRDVRGKEAVQIDVVLLDILRGMQGWYEAHGQYKPIYVNSGYRNKATNAETKGSAKNSFHTKGRAADIYMPGVSTKDLEKLAKYLRGGGVGVYHSRGFIHIDTGGLRTWRG
ncbi:YcbK family protein [Limnobacter alexandrii]|jgi:uncharacterized protein YcbK (DUF882 family)|nr:DUF882 domain-containing protein [Limnobacter alexandrii]